ncbi:DHA2 family efflux MFS transporter permease subunit [Conexibacter sp. DBS9H8]|uniref:DHA2 family efflux MFS transporter permease subunit n=1 Tax=Conexibacter sp. DBS9H8 TaxID=2937801 RepID=UPI00200E8B54|nr:DHA2 family efflux MFS transporter permease subunit [Conexibacter sp. DBS9H8]
MPESASPSPSVLPGSDKIPRQVWIVSGVAMLGAVMSILDTTIVNVALDTLGKDLHSSLSNIQWVITGYMLSLAAVIPVTGWASRRFGAKRVFLISLFLFTLGSFLCGISTTATELILFRVLQGVGGGMIMPLAQILMADAAGPKRMGRVMGLVAVPMMLAPTLGPLLGGVIIQGLSWHWIFFVNIIVGAIAIPLGIRILPSRAGEKTDSLDFTGLILMSTGLVAITYGLAEAGTYNGFNNTHVYIPVIIGALLVAAFAVHALRITHPLLDLNLYRRRHFSAASIVMFALGAAVFGAMILMPLYWQELRGYNVIDTGLLTGPQGLGMAITMPLAAKLTERYGGGPVALVGVIATALMTVPFALIGAHTSVPYLAVAMVFRGAGMGASFMPAMTAAFAALDRSEVSHATPQLNVLNRVGGSIGTTVLAVVLADAERHAHTPAAAAAAFGTAFWWSVAIAGLAIIPCVVLMRAESQSRREAKAAGLSDPEADALHSGAVAEALV